ncbi:glycosyltransferase family 4 protein [Kocuria sp. CPCC 205292]|uniref:glycosyltransferase family 4 protein n=1 Tax=Kocuria cellulosilytica TaxID=3071451 RepID=UPI0034D67F8B
MNVELFGFEDPAKPDAGGGSRRNHEIFKRLTDEVQTTIYTAKYPGAVPHESDGLKYRPIGVSDSYTPAVLSYFSAAVFKARASHADLIIEDFAAPIGSVSLSRFTKVPSLAQVQWLNAKEKSIQYHLPLVGIQNAGVRAYDRFVTVSEGIANRIQNINPQASIEVIANGVSDEAFNISTSMKRSGFVFLGRIERAQKGLDLLLDSWDKGNFANEELRIIGCGPDLDWLTSAIASRSQPGRIRVLGPLEGAEKYHALATARAVVMPSRFETFGIVAIEAQAVGTPVIAYDIDCLREVLPRHLNELTAPFDTRAFASAIEKVMRAPGGTVETEQRRNFATKFRWSHLSREMLRVVRSVAESKPLRSI